MTASISIYSARNSGFHRLHPLTKLAVTGFFLFSALIVPPRFSYVFFTLALVPLAMWAKVLIPLLSSAARVVLPFTLSLTIVLGFFAHLPGPDLVQIGPIGLNQAGVVRAIETTGRILLVLSSFLLLSLTTKPDALMQALVKAGLPHMIAYTVLTTMQIAPRFSAKANTILDAQRARGLETEGGFIQRSKALIPLVVPLVLGSIVDVEERAVALEARGFSRRGEKTTLYDLHDSEMQRFIRWGIGLGVILLAAVRVIIALV